MSYLTIGEILKKESLGPQFFPLIRRSAQKFALLQATNAKTLVISAWHGVCI